MILQDLRYQMVVGLFILINFYPSPEDNIYKKIIFSILLLLILFDIIQYLIKYFKNLQNKKH